MMQSALFFVGLTGGAMASGYFLGRSEWVMAATALLPAFFFLIRLIGDAP